MRQTRRYEAFDTFLKGEVVLVALLSAALALFLSKSSLRTPYHLPELRLILWTLCAAGAGLLALLTAIRFRVDGRRFELMLFAGFSTIALTWVVFVLAPAVARKPETSADTWARLVGELVAWALIACAPFVPGALSRRKLRLTAALGFVIGAIVAISVSSHAHMLPRLDLPGKTPAVRSVMFAALALLNLVAAVAFGDRFRRRGEELDTWLALGATLTLFASLDFFFGPLTPGDTVTQGDFIRLLGFAVFVVGVWHAIQSSEFGRAVADERSRVAREIHDGLAQYLFAISTHASMLEAGADSAATIPKLKEAVQAAQVEARFAVLALSSAAGRSRFDAALRRYVDVLTADGELEVELEIDGTVRLAPDEQIEVFRIVQEGLANVRRHAQAKQATVTIARRGGERLVTVRDDGSGFEPEADSAAQGLKNIRQRAAAIGGALSLTSAPGRGTALEVVLRP